MLLVSVRVMAIFIEVIKLETNICYYEPPDWWGKMSVDWRCQPIMQELFFREHSWTEVNRLHHASCCHNTKQRVKVGFIRDISSIQRDREGFGTVDLKMHTLTAEKKNHGFVLWCTARHLTKPFSMWLRGICYILIGHFRVAQSLCFGRRHAQSLRYENDYFTLIQIYLIFIGKSLK